MVTLNTSSVPIPFGGGLRTVSPLEAADNQSINCKNVHSDKDKILLRRKGTTALGTAGSGTTGNGMFEYLSTPTTRFLMSYVDAKLYKMDHDGTNYDGTLDEISFDTAMADDYMEFAQITESGTSYLVMSTHSRSVLQRWDGVTGVTIDLSSDANLFAPKFIMPWRGFLFCANMSGLENRVGYNNVQNAYIGATDWVGTDFQTISTNDGDVITGLAILRGRLITFKNFSIHKWDYLGGVPLFEIKEVVTGIGTPSSKSIININHPRLGEILMFLGSDKKFYAFDGNQVIPISTNIEKDNSISEFNMTKIDKANHNKAASVNYRKRSWAVNFVPTGTSNDWCLVWDYSVDSWWPFDQLDAVSCGIAQHGGDDDLFFMEDDGVVVQFDRGNTDQGSGINANYETKKFDAGQMPLLKETDHVDIHARNTPDSALNFYHRADYKPSWGDAKSLDLDQGGFILGTSLLGDTLGGASAGIITVDIPSINQLIQFRLGGTDSATPWELISMQMVLSGVGHGSAYNK